MDNLREINESPKQGQVPSHWQFEEKGDPFKIVQLDTDNGYLAFVTGPPWNKMKRNINMEYLFNSNGSPFIRRAIFSQLEPLDPGQYVGIVQQGELHVYYGFYNFFSGKGGVCIGFSKALDYPLRPPMRDGLYTLEDSVSFSREGIVEKISISCEERGVKDVHNPELIFLNKKGEFINGDYDHFYRMDRADLSLLDQGEPNKLVFVNKEGKREHVLAWHTVVEDNNGNKTPFFIVTQSHLEEDAVKELKTLRSPIQIDMEKVKSVLLSKPPYPKDENGRLVLPWRKIDRIVGASLSYSYPPENKS